MADRRSAHRTQWVAQFAVASELCKRNYQVALTMGNHPEADLMVISPEGVQFIVDVKGQYKKNWWLISPKKKRKNLFYVLAYVPDEKPNEYFILTQDEVDSERERYLVEKKAERTRKGLSIDNVGRFPGLSSAVASGFRDKWKKLPK